MQYDREMLCVACTTRERGKDFNTLNTKFSGIVDREQMISDLVQDPTLPISFDFHPALKILPSIYGKRNPNTNVLEYVLGFCEPSNPKLRVRVQSVDQRYGYKSGKLFDVDRCVRYKPGQCETLNFVYVKKYLDENGKVVQIPTHIRLVIGCAMGYLDGDAMPHMQEEYKKIYCNASKITDNGGMEKYDQIVKNGGGL